MVVIESGRVIDMRPLQYEKAPVRIVVSVSGNSTEVISLQYLNEFSKIDATGAVMTSVCSFTHGRQCTTPRGSLSLLFAICRPKPKQLPKEVGWIALVALRRATVCRLPQELNA